jgi:hypothetical protein
MRAVASILATGSEPTITASIGLGFCDLGFHAGDCVNRIRNTETSSRGSGYRGLKCYVKSVKHNADADTTKYVTDIYLSNVVENDMTTGMVSPIRIKRRDLRGEFSDTDLSGVPSRAMPNWSDIEKLL